MTGPELRQWIEAELPSVGSPAYWIDQTADKLPVFVKLPDSPSVPSDWEPGKSLTGRAFGPDVELRWLASGTGFRSWKISRWNQDEEVRSYYCLGTQSKDGVFREGNLNTPLSYPEGLPCGENFRPFVKVAELKASKPQAFEDQIGRAHV